MPRYSQNVKTVAGGVQFIFGTSNQPPYKYASIEIRDTVSGLLIAKATLEPDQIFNLMSSREARGEMDVFDTFENLGKRYEHESIVITDDRLNEWRQGYRGDNAERAWDQLRDILASHRDEYETAGWMLKTDFISLSQGQHNVHLGTFKTYRYRYVEPDTEGAAVQLP